jgi:hypothetical protein
LGKVARYWRSSFVSSAEGTSGGTCRQKRSAHTGGPKEAFTADESSLGGKKKSRRKGEILWAEERCAYTCRPKKTLRADESALGSQKERRREITTAVATSIRESW